MRCVSAAAVVGRGFVGGDGGGGGAADRVSWRSGREAREKRIVIDGVGSIVLEFLGVAMAEKFA
jgi:hypothetical protein